MGTPHTMTQHLNLLNREPGLNCFTLPGNHRVEEKRRDKPSLGHLPPIQVCSPSCLKDGKDMKSTCTYLLLLLLLEFMYFFKFDLILLSLGFMLRIFGQKSALMYKNISVYLKTSVFEVSKGT